MGAFRAPMMRFEIIGQARSSVRYRGSSPEPASCRRLDCRLGYGLARGGAAEEAMAYCSCVSFSGSFGT